MPNAGSWTKLVFFSVAYIAYSLWFYATVTKGWFCDPHDDGRLDREKIGDPLFWYGVLIHIPMLAYAVAVWQQLSPEQAMKIEKAKWEIRLLLKKCWLFQ